jgi:hypothetical protein
MTFKYIYYIINKTCKNKIKTIKSPASYKNRKKGIKIIINIIYNSPVDSPKIALNIKVILKNTPQI